MKASMTPSGITGCYMVASCSVEDRIEIGDWYRRNQDWGMLLSDSYRESVSYDETAVFALHIDIGIKNDATGIALAHIQGYKDLPSMSKFNGETGGFVEIMDIKAPVFCIDGLLQIYPPNNGEVDLEKVRSLCFYLCSELNIKFATLDTYESSIFIQGFQKMKIRSGAISVVSSPVPYMELKAAYVEGRMLHGSHTVYEEELMGLEYDPKKMKIDHHPSGKPGKDVADCVASVVHILQHKVANFGRSRRSIRLNKKDGASK